MTVTSTISFDGNMVRAIDHQNGNLLVGCRNGSIFHCNGGNQKEIMSSHHDGELWGLASGAGKVVTSADDNQVIIWDVENKKKSSCVIVSNEKRQSKAGRASTLSKMPASQCSRAVIYRDDGCLVVAANDGRVHVWDNIAASAPARTLNDSAEWI